MPSFQFPVKSGKSMLMAVMWRIRYVSIFQSLKTCLQQTTKIITFHQLTVFSDRMSLLIVHAIQPLSTVSIFWKDRCGIQLKMIKSSKSTDFFWPRAFHSCPQFFVIYYTRISRGPSQQKSGSFNSKYHSTSQSTAENHLPMYEPLPSSRQSHAQNDPKTLPSPRPAWSAASTVAPAEISCSTTAAWPSWAARCSAVRPRASRMRRGRRGSCGCRRETRRIVMGCFSGWLGKKMIEDDRRSAKLILLVYCIF